MLLPLIECNEIPDNTPKVAQNQYVWYFTPEVAQKHPHLKSISSEIPKLEQNAHILLLLSHDILRVHKPRQQINGPHNTPFALKLDLGWVLVGDVHLGNVLENGTPSFFTPCQSHIHLKEKLSIRKVQHAIQ